jgi:hypothetical protein|tara:strand:+ start:22 stop:516 length:495 start_codon:yes stop_codon:yes gene_type:complete
MKKLLLILLCLPFIGFGQSCKYQKNEIDKFTKKEIKITKEKILWKNPMGGNTLSFYLSSVNDKKSITIRYSKGSVFTIKNGNSLALLLENGESLNLQTPISVVSTYSGSNWYAYANYSLPEDAISLLNAHNLTDVRIITTKSFIDKTIKGKKQARIIENLKCID